MSPSNHSNLINTGGAFESDFNLINLPSREDIKNTHDSEEGAEDTPQRFKSMGYLTVGDKSLFLKKTTTMNYNEGG